MVERRTPFLTHAVLIFLIILILFPVVWVVSTSIRRDEAAFSTKLFTSRVTLQNYVDLLAPEKNIPVLVQELQNIISRVKPYDRITLEQAKKLTEKYIKRLELYLQETENRSKLAKQSYSTVASRMQENVELIRNSVFDSLEKLKEIVEKNLPLISLDENYALVLYEKLRNERFNSPTFVVFKEDLERLFGQEVNDAETFGKALSELNAVYARKLGLYLEELKNYEKRLSDLSFVAAELTKRISAIQTDVVNANLFLNEAILPELRSLSQAFVSLVELKAMVQQSAITSPFAVDDSKMLLSAQELQLRSSSILQTLESYADYTELTQSLATLQDCLARIANREEEITRKAQYVQIVNLYDDLEPRIDRIFSQIEEIFEETGEKILQLKTLNEQLVEVQADIEDKKVKKANIEAQISKVNQSLEEYRRFAELKLFKAQLDERITMVKNIRSLSTADLTRYSAVLSFVRNFANSYESGDQISLQLSRTTDDMRWIEEYRDFVRRFENTSKNLEETLSAARKLLDDLKKTYEGLLSVSFAGNFVRSEVLNRLSDLIRTDFVNKVKADMTVASRRAGNLMDRSPITSLKDEYMMIDKQFYRIDNIWKQKPKHYFLNWVLNSVVVASVVGIITTAVCAVAAYPFSRMRFRGRKYGLLSFLLIQMFPAVIFMIAIYNLLNFLGRYVPFLGIDTLGGLIFSYLTGIAYNMYLMKGFYDTIPPSLEEAAIVDGATRFQSFYKIILPLSRPILVVVFLLVFIGTFNEFVVARIVLQNVKNYTYALGLQTFAVGPYETEWGLFTAAALLGMMPMVILFLSMQRFLVSGLTRGAVKE